MEEVHHDVFHDELGLLTPDDMAFVHGVIGRDIVTAEELNRVLNDPAARANVLDSPRLFEVMSENLRELNVSEYFYYSCGIRQLMLSAGLREQDYTDNVAASLVRMAHMQRKSLDRGESCARYLPIRVHVVKERGDYGCHIRIYSRMEPYEMLLEGFQVDLDAYKKGSAAPAGKADVHVA